MFKTKTRSHKYLDFNERTSIKNNIQRILGVSKILTYTEIKFLYNKLLTILQYKNKCRLYVYEPFPEFSLRF